MLQSLVLALAVALAVQSPAAPATTYRLAAIEVTGARWSSTADVARLSGLTIGAPVTDGLLKAAADRLASSGLFKQIRYRYTTTGTQLTVTFQIEEAAWTIPVVFDNLIWFSDEEIVAAIRKDVPSFDGMLPDLEGAPDLVVRSLQSLLKTRGVPGVAGMTPQADLKTGKMQYLFKVSHPAPLVCAFELRGASSGVERELREATSPVVGKAYSRSYVTAMSQGTLLDIYYRRGHWRASIAPPAAGSAAGCAGAIVTLNVEEGPVYAWSPEEWSGNAAIPDSDLRKALDLKPGDVADSLNIADGLRRVARAYGRIGHVTASTKWSPRLDDASKRATPQITVTEGPQFRMGKLAFAGISPSDAETLRKRWKLAEGAVYDDSYLMDFLTREVRPRRQGSPSPHVLVTPDTASRTVGLLISFPSQ